MNRHRAKLSKFHEITLLECFVEGDFQRVAEHTQVTVPRCRVFIRELLEKKGYNINWSGRRGEARKEQTKRQIYQDHFAPKPNPEVEAFKRKNPLGPDDIQ